MNSNQPRVPRSSRPPADPIGYTARRLSSILVVAAAIGGLFVVSALEEAGEPLWVALATGIALFVTTALVATEFDARQTEMAPANDPRRHAGSTAETRRRPALPLGPHDGALPGPLGKPGPATKA